MCQLWEMKIQLHWKGLRLLGRLMCIVWAVVLDPMLFLDAQMVVVAARSAFHQLRLVHQL